MIGQVIADRYRLVRKLGEGGMGEVYEAEHIHIEKRVALKLLRAEILSNAEAVTRFRQEARSASSIGHKNIIEIDDFGTLPDGRVYMTMEFLNGAPMSDLAKQGLQLQRALDILIQTCIGLGAAHAKGIVHRDMKPDNVFVTWGADGRDVPKILDFGIAKISGHDSAQAHLTRTGTIFGTPYYMAPEQALGQAIDHRADVYAMGVIMFEVFAGQVPFKADSFMAILTMHITSPPPPPSQIAAAHGRWVPPELEAIILRAMAKDPNERFQSMNDMAQALQTVYRQYVGAGSTQPLAGQPQSPSGFMPVPSGHISSQGGAMSTPMPTVPPQGYSGMLAAQSRPSSTPIPSSGFAASVPPPSPVKSGGKGLIIGIVAFLVLGGGGAAAWYFLAGPGAKKAQPVAVNEPGKEPVKEPPTKEPPAKDPVVSGSGSASQAQGHDAQGTGSGSTATPEVTGSGSGSQAAPEVERIKVQIESKPSGAAIYDGDTLLDKTPCLIPVEKGKPLKVALILEGYEDEEVLLDGSETKIKRTLSKEKHHRPPSVPGTRPPPDPGTVKPNLPDPGTKPPPDPGDSGHHNKPPPSDRCPSDPSLKKNDPDCLE